MMITTTRTIMMTMIAWKRSWYCYLYSLLFSRCHQQYSSIEKKSGGRYPNLKATSTYKFSIAFYYTAYPRIRNGDLLLEIVFLNYHLYLYFFSFFGFIRYLPVSLKTSVGKLYIKAIVKKYLSCYKYNTVKLRRRLTKILQHDIITWYEWVDLYVVTTHSNNLLLY